MSANAKRRATDVLLVAAFCALAAGVAGTVILATRHFVLGEIVLAPLEVTWLSPVGHLMAFGLLAVPLAAAALRWPGAVSLRLVSLTFLLLGAFSVLLHLPWLHWLASLAVAMGCAVRLATAWASDWPRARDRMQRAVLILLAAGGVWVGGTHGLASLTLWLHARRAPVPPPGAPNVLLIVLDTFRAANLSLYGASRPTSPRLVSLAAEGVAWDRAVAVSSWSLPTHSSLFTGYWPSQLSGRWTRPLDARRPTLAEVMRDAGWRTFGLSANHVYGSWESGLSRGFLEYASYVLTPRQALLTVPMFQTRLADRLRNSNSVGDVVSALLPPSLRVPFGPYRVQRRAPEVTGRFLEWHARHRDRPFFAFLNYFDAHNPERLDPRYRRLFNDGRTPMDRYDGALFRIDESIGILVDSLAARGDLDSTLIIVTADHGELFGEGGLHAHGNALYMRLLHVPLIARLPGRLPSGHRVTSEVSLRDVPATILELAGIPVDFPGVSLMNWASDGRPASPAIAELERAARPGGPNPAARGPMRSITWDGWHYIRNGDGEEELYRWLEDPDETRNLAGMRTARGALAEGRARLTAVPGGYPDGPP